MIRRREFIVGLGGAAAWPLAAHAQQRERVRRIGVLMPWDEDEPVARPIVSVFTEALADLGWTVGRNVRMDLRWGRGDINRMRALALGRPATRHHRDSRDRGDPCRSAGEADDPDCLCERERPRSQRHRPAA